MKIVIAGSFAVYEEIKSLAERLETIPSVECILPKFFKGYTNSAQIEKLKKKFKAGTVKLKNDDLLKIGEAENWFFEQIGKADIILVYNKKRKEGEIGINVAVDVGYSLGKDKRVIFLFDPLDAGIKALGTSGERNTEIVRPDKVVNFLAEETKTAKKCDHTSVGMHVWRDGKLLLIERRKFPFGFAPPVGHLDNRSSFEKAAKEELEEEVGLRIKNLKLLLEERKDNSCRRKGGRWHYWKIYQVEANGKVRRSLTETKQAGWYSKKEIETLAKRTERYLGGQIPEDEWQKSPGLEPVWYKWMKELKVIE